MKKITKIIKKKLKIAYINISSDVYLMQGNYKLYFLFLLKKFNNTIKNEPNLTISSFIVRATEIIEEACPSNTENNKFDKTKFTKFQNKFYKIIDNQPEFVKSYLNNTDFNKLNSTDFLTRYESIKEKNIYTHKQKQKDRVFEKSRQLFDTPGKMQQAVRLLSYYDEAIDLKLSGNYNKRLGVLSKLIGRDITGFTTIFAEPYRKSDKKLTTIEKNLNEIKNIFIELEIYEATKFIDRDIQNRLL